MNTKPTFGERLAQCLKEKGIGQEDAARAIGTSQSSISRWMKEGPPSKFIVIQALGIYLNKNPEWLLTGEGPSDLKASEREISLKALGMSQTHGPIIDLCSAVDHPTLERLKPIMEGKNQHLIATNTLRGLADMGEKTQFRDDEKLTILPEAIKEDVTTLIAELLQIAAKSNPSKDQVKKIEDMVNAASAFWSIGFEIRRTPITFSPPKETSSEELAPKPGKSKGNIVLALLNLLSPVTGGNATIPTERKTTQ